MWKTSVKRSTCKRLLLEQRMAQGTRVLAAYPYRSWVYIEVSCALLSSQFNSSLIQSSLHPKYGTRTIRAAVMAPSNVHSGDRLTKAWKNIVQTVHSSKDSRYGLSAIDPTLSGSTLQGTSRGRAESDPLLDVEVPLRIKPYPQYAGAMGSKSGRD